MNSLFPLVVANLRNSYRNKLSVLVMLGLIVLLLAVLVGLICGLAILPQMRSAAPDLGAVARYLALLVYGTGFLAMGMNLTVFTSNNLVREKAQRIYETILGGPVSARKFWLAKSLGVFLPGFALCELISLATLFAVGALVIGGAMGPVVSPMLLFNGLVLVPILYFPLSCLVILVGLTGNPVSGTVISNVAYSGLITLLINLVTRAGLDVGSPAFCLASLALSAVLGALVLILQLGLTKERVVLSCRS